MPICPVTKKYKFTVPVTKNMHLLRRNFAPLWPRVPKFWYVRFEFGLHRPVNFYQDPLRFAGVIREKPILSK